MQVGPYAVIGEGVKVGPETTIGAHAVLEGPTEIGARNQIFPGAAIGLAPQDRKYDGSNTQVKIGNDNRIREYVTIHRATYAGGATIIGEGNLLLAYVHVAHDCVIEDEVVISNSAALGGHVHVESRATIGGMVGIHQFVHVGRLAMLSAMSRIDRDVPPYMLVEGHPARVRQLNLVGLKRAGIAEVDQGQGLQTLKEAFRLIYRSDLPLTQALEKLELLPENQYLQHLHRFLQLSYQLKGQGRRGPTPGKKSKDEE